MISWVDEIETVVNSDNGMAYGDVAKSDIRDLIKAVRVMEEALEYIAQPNAHHSTINESTRFTSANGALEEIANIRK
jgi:hypothetical protein